MNMWTFIQLCIDVGLFATLALYFLRDSRKNAEIEQMLANPPTPAPAPSVDMAELEKLMDELARLVSLAEKVAVRLEKGVELSKPEEAKPRVKPTSKAEQKKAPVPDIPAKEENARTLEEDERYAKATKLIKKGLPDDKIGKMVDLPTFEISLIRKMGA